ncbi:MAG: phosphopentomutase [Clostridium sp.]|jgi:phosphopentomutase|nr:phosphopentomutase [Clostridium sp.]
MKRVFLIVLDSFGIGAMEDAFRFGDGDVNTLRSVSFSPYFHMPNMKKLGLFGIDGVAGELPGAGAVGPPPDREAAGSPPGAVVARMAERSQGKDTIIGHWEIAGIFSAEPLPTYPDGFPEEVVGAFCAGIGREILCNRPYSGTEVIRVYGEEHVHTGKPILYTSADSVFQIAAHEDVIPLEELYRYCRVARAILTGKHGVGRVIARPFAGEAGGYYRTARRHDFSLLPPAPTMLDQLKDAGLEVIGVGKIHDIFAGQGLTRSVSTAGNADGIRRTLEYLEEEFEGLCFVNLVDFDMLYGHRNDVDGYAKALGFFDAKLPELFEKMKPGDLLMITADHGCDPGYKASTDHSREYVPFLMCGGNLAPANLGTRKTFADIGATVLQYFGITPGFAGEPCGFLE